jgi:Pyruvate/2-oxoacid:ferredoxin oxidoreductase gamma subunit
MKKGFGLLEVMAASVALAFMMLALTILQKGNRESIIRIRARDAANVIAQEIIDSISALGSASVLAASEPDTIFKKRAFEGKAGYVEMEYTVLLEVRPAEDQEQTVNEQTDYMIAVSGDPDNNLSVRHQLSKQINVTVNWEFKKTNQSINMSTVIR